MVTPPPHIEDCTLIRMIFILGLIGVYGLEVRAQELASKPVIEVGFLSTLNGKEVEAEVRTSVPVVNRLAFRSSWARSEGVRGFVVIDFKLEDHDEPTTSFAEIAFGPGMSQGREGGPRGVYAVTVAALRHPFSVSFEMERRVSEEAHHGAEKWIKATVLRHFGRLEAGLMYHHNHLLDFKGAMLMVPIGGEHHPMKVWSAASPQGAVLFGLSKHW